MSPLSFSGEDYAYLEEDCDAGIFLDAVEESGWKISLENIYVNEFPHYKIIGEHLRNLEDDPRCYWCQEDGEEFCECPQLLCPVCGDNATCGGENSLSNFSCNHMLVGWENDELVFSALTIVDGISNKAVDEYEWKEEKLREFFGAMLPLFDCFRYGGGDVRTREFWQVLAELVPGIKYSSFSDQPAGARISWEADMYFIDGPEKTKKRAEALLKKLKQGYEQLTKLLPPDC